MSVTRPPHDDGNEPGAGAGGPDALGEFLNAGGDGGPGARREGRMASEIGKAVQAILAKGLSDPRIGGLITVTRVEILDQRRLARVWVTVLPDDKAELTLHGLRAATGHVRKAAMGKVRSRFFPKIEFRYDEDYLRQREVLGLIAKAERERAEAGGAANDDAQEAADEAPGDPRPGGSGGRDAGATW